MTRMRPRAALPATPLYSPLLFATSPYSPLTPLCSFAPFLYSAAPAPFTVCGRCLIYASLPEVTFTPALGTHCAPATAAEFDALIALRQCPASAGARKQRRLCCPQPQMRSQAAQTCSRSRTKLSPAQQGAKHACEPPHPGHPKPREHQKSRERHEFTS